MKLIAGLMKVTKGKLERGTYVYLAGGWSLPNWNNNRRFCDSVGMGDFIVIGINYK